MGRGRQKAKDAKIARQLKYTHHGSDLRELERELIARDAAASSAASEEPADSDDDYYDRWADEDEKD